MPRALPQALPMLTMLPLKMLLPLMLLLPTQGGTAPRALAAEDPLAIQATSAPAVVWGSAASD